jgi:hypothetical protein
MLKSVLSRTLGKTQVSSTTIESTNAHTSTPLPSISMVDDHLPYADAGALNKLLIEQSRRSKSGLFKAEAPRRPKMRRRHSEGETLKGTEAPKSTPDLLFLSKCPSSSSAGISSPPEQQMRSLSLTETCSTVPEVDPTGGEIEVDDADREEHQGFVSKVPINKEAVNDSAIVPGIPTNTSFSFGSNIRNAKRWSRKIIHDIKRPMTREKVRQGKLPAKEITSPQPSTLERSGKNLEEVLKQPSTSDCLKGFNLEGGRTAPKRFSEKTVRTLEKFDRKEEFLKKRLARIDRDRRLLIRSAELRDVEENEDGIDGTKVKEKKTLTWTASVRMPFRKACTGEPSSVNVQSITMT